MLLSELQNKTLISMNDGRNIGTIVDVKVDEVNGNILSLIIEQNKKGFSFTSKGNQEEIKWDNINKIGEDVILINVM